MLRPCYPMRSSTQHYDGSQLSINNYLKFESWMPVEDAYLMLDAVFTRWSLENLTPRLARRTQSEFFSTAEGTKCHRRKTVQEHLSLTTASLQKVHDVIEKMRATKRLELKHADFQATKLKKMMALMQKELDKEEAIASELRRELRMTIGTGYTARKTPSDSPGRFFTFKPQAEYWNQRAYEEIPKGARGHMLVVLDSPNSEDKVHVLTVSGSLYHDLSTLLTTTQVTSYDQVEGVEFCPIAPTPQGDHRLQVLMNYSFDMFAGASRLRNSRLRMEAFLVPYDILSPVVCTLIQSEVTYEIQPCLQEPSLEKVLVMLRGI